MAKLLEDIGEICGRNVLMKSRFIYRKKTDYPELEDRDCIVKLVFLSGITKHLNDFSLLLQGAGKTVMDLYDIWEAFVAKLAIYSTDIKTGYFRYFKNLSTLLIFRCTCNN